MFCKDGCVILQDLVFVLNQRHLHDTVSPTGVGCHFLLQRTFLTQGLNLFLLHWQADSLPSGNHQGNTAIWLWSMNKLLWVWMVLIHFTNKMHLFFFYYLGHGKISLFEAYLFFPALLGYNWHMILCKSRCTTWWFDVCILWNDYYNNISIS